MTFHRETERNAMYQLFLEITTSALFGVFTAILLIPIVYFLDIPHMNVGRLCWVTPFVMAALKVMRIGLS